MQTTKIKYRLMNDYMTNIRGRVCNTYVGYSVDDNNIPTMTLAFVSGTIPEYHYDNRTILTEKALTSKNKDLILKLTFSIYNGHYSLSRNDGKDFFVDDLYNMIESVNQSSAKIKYDKLIILRDNIEFNESVVTSPHPSLGSVIESICDYMYKYISFWTYTHYTTEIVNFMNGHSLIGYRAFHTSDPSNMEHDTYVKATDTLVNKCRSYGFIFDTTDYHGFDNSVGSVFRNFVGCFTIAHFYQELYRDERKAKQKEINRYRGE